MRHFSFHLLLLSLITIFWCSCSDSPQEPLGAPSPVVYECNERLFAQARAFETIEAYVPEMERMQVNVLWLMPIHPRGTKNAVGSPYCIKNHYAIDPAFGTMEDLRHLVNTCHGKNIRVILDWVANHTSWDNAWVKDHPEWYQSAQTSDEQMWNDVTFLDYSNQEVRDSMTACMLYWVNEADIDGFRCDYAHGVPNEFWQQATSAIREVKPDAFMLAETKNVSYFNSGFDLLYSWNYLTAIENVYSGTKSIASLISISKSEFASTPEGKDRLRYITTHDECYDKAPSSIYQSAAGELSAFCLTIFMGGVPMIYSSQELGYMNTINFFDYKILAFRSSNPTRDALAELMTAYQNTRLLRTGTKQAGALGNKIAYVEYTRGDAALLVLCNTANSVQSASLPAAYQGARMQDLLGSTSQTLGESIELAAYEYRLYRK